MPGLEVAKGKLRSALRVSICQSGTVTEGFTYRGWGKSFRNKRQPPSVSQTPVPVLDNRFTSTLLADFI